MSESAERDDHSKAMLSPLLWVVLGGAPLVFLLDLTAVYGLTSWVCGAGATALLHALHALALLLIVGGGGGAWREWRRAGGGWPGDGADVQAHRRFLAVLAVLGSAGFALLVLGMWVPLWILDPCARM